MAGNLSAEANCFSFAMQKSVDCFSHHDTSYSFHPLQMVSAELPCPSLALPVVLNKLFTFYVSQPEL